MSENVSVAGVRAVGTLGKSSLVGEELKKESPLLVRKGFQALSSGGSILFLETERGVGTLRCGESSLVLLQVV